MANAVGVVPGGAHLRDPGIPSQGRVPGPPGGAHVPAAGLPLRRHLCAAAPPPHGARVPGGGTGGPPPCLPGRLEPPADRGAQRGAGGGGAGRGASERVDCGGPAVEAPSSPLDGHRAVCAGSRAEGGWGEAGHRYPGDRPGSALCSPGRLPAAGQSHRGGEACERQEGVVDSCGGIWAVHLHPLRIRGRGEGGAVVGGGGSGPGQLTPARVRLKDSRAESGVGVQVTVELSNPCAFELVIESISLSVSAPFEAFPLSLALPPNTLSQMIILGGVPRAAGPLAIRGCFVRCFGVLVEQRFAAKREDREAGAAEDLADPFRGKKEEAPKLEVLVLPPLPLLVAELQGGEGAPVLFEGEVREVGLRLTNVGAVALTSAHLGLAGKQREQVRSIGHALLQAALPLPPGASVEVPIVFQGHFRGKEDICASLTVHYAGEEGEEGGGTEAAEPPPGRRLSLPLQLHVQRGLFLVRARLLAMGGGRSSDTKLYRPPSLSKEQVEVEVAVREGKGLRLLELELWNGTDVGFRVGTTIVDGGGEGVEEEDEEEGDGEEEEGDGEERMTRIDRECSARVLIPVEPLSPAAQEGPDVRSSSEGGGEEKQFVLRNPTWTVAQTKAAAMLERAVEELCARVRVTWKSGRNSRGQLLIRHAVREALQGAAMEIMLPDVITFHFRFGGGSNEVASSGGHLRVVAHEVTDVDLVVRSRVERAMPLRVSVSCENVTGTHCLGTEGGASTVLWAGSVNGVEMAVPANGAVTHTFSLCFLVPGEYSILASALVPSHYLEDAGEMPLPPTDTIPQTCCRGSPHKVYVEAR